MSTTCQVYGNYGSLTIDRETGNVIAYQPDIDATETEGYYDIARVEPSHMHPTGDCDILCCGYWLKDGAYEAKAMEPM